MRTNCRRKTRAGRGGALLLTVPALSGAVAADAGTDPTNKYAWGENIGWVKFSDTSPDYGVRTLAFDNQPKGTPNYWLAGHGVTEDHDAGDGVPASDKYVMDVDPTVSGNALRITSITPGDGKADVAFTPASTRRYYTLTRRGALTDGDWLTVDGQADVPGDGGEQTLTDEEPATTMFYGVTVTVHPRAD